MQKCTECKIEYPNGYTFPMFTSEGNQVSVCGICALLISNKVLGITRKKFDGELAEEARQKAIKYRRLLIDTKRFIKDDLRKII